MTFGCAYLEHMRISYICRQTCGHYGQYKYTYHDENGVPVVEQSLFPDFKKMTDYAHDLGLTAGFVAVVFNHDVWQCYANNYRTCKNNLCC